MCLCRDARKHSSTFTSLCSLFWCERDLYFRHGTTWRTSRCCVQGMISCRLWYSWLLLSCSSSSFLAHITSNADISLQRGRFWAMSVASFSRRLLDFRSCWIIFIHVVRGRLDGLLQCSLRGSCQDLSIYVVWHSHNVAEQGETPCLDNSWKVWLLGCPSHRIIPHMVVPFDS